MSRSGGRADEQMLRALSRAIEHPIVAFVKNSNPGHEGFFTWVCGEHFRAPAVPVYFNGRGHYDLADDVCARAQGLGLEIRSAESTPGRAEATRIMAAQKSKPKPLEDRVHEEFAFIEPRGIAL
eukprot:1393169-Pyramimonas_sp.AAC.1